MPDLTNMYQNVYLELSNGTVAMFSGKAILENLDNVNVVSVSMGYPTRLPDGCTWENLDNDDSTTTNNK